MTDKQLKPTEDQVYRAALEWCGEKERETFPEDITYFCNMWDSLSGLRARVERLVEREASDDR